MTIAVKASFRRLFFTLCAAGGIGTVVGLGLYVTKTAYVAALPLLASVVIVGAVVKNFRLYWFVIFLLSLQFEIAKNLNDGREVVKALEIDYTIWNFTFQITASDLALLVLLAIWANDRLFHGRPLRFPPISWLALGYIGICTLSTVGAPSPYLGLVQLSHEIKLFILYLFAVNCLDSKKALRVLAAVAVVILVIQGAMTLVRYETGYINPVFGTAQQDASVSEDYLKVDRSTGGSSVRGFGTLNSPGSTTRLCMMLIPIALFLCVRNAMFSMPIVFAAATAFALLSLVLTFTRVYYILTAMQCGLVFLIWMRDGVLKRQEVVLIVMAGLAGIAAVSPKLYEQFAVRGDSMTVRFLQYEAAVTMMVDNPLLGVGLNNSTGEKPKYTNLTFSRRDPNTQFHLEPTHNMYLLMASEIGIVGTLLFLVFFVRVANVAWRQSRDSDDPEIRLVANAFVVVFCTVAVNGFMDPFQDQGLVLFWLYAGICLNLPAMAASRQTVPAVRPRARLRRGFA